MNPDTDLSSADLRFFVTVAGANSLAAAARELDVSRSAVTQRLRQLEERGWIESIGYRDVIGRPALFATTKQFLDDLGLASLNQLPPLDANASPAWDALAQTDSPQLDMHRIWPDPNEVAMPPPSNF